MDRKPKPWEGGLNDVKWWFWWLGMGFWDGCFWANLSELRGFWKSQPPTMGWFKRPYDLPRFLPGYLESLPREAARKLTGKWMAVKTWINLSMNYYLCTIFKAKFFAGKGCLKLPPKWCFFFGDKKNHKRFLQKCPLPPPKKKKKKNRFTSYTHHPKTNIAPENGCLKD